MGDDFVIGELSSETGIVNVLYGNITIVSSLIVGQAGAGVISLRDGSISCNALTINAPGLIDIGSDGELIINGDAEPGVNAYITAGKIIANGRDSTVAVDYNVNNPGKTTVKAGYVIARDGDLNCDDMVDYNDLAVLAEQWLQQRGYPPYAYIAPATNGDAMVNFLDFASVAEYWLENATP